MIAAALALVLAPAPVYIEMGSTAAETSSLRDQLMIRLLEEGYPLAPSAEHATRTLRVETTDRGIRVTARGEDTQSFEIATGPVLPLEAVHRAMEALDEVTPRAEPVSAALPRYAVHVTGAPPQTSAEAVRRALVRGLLERRAAVVPLDAEPEAVFCADGADDAIALSRGEGPEDCGRRPQRAEWRPPERSAREFEGTLDALMVEPAPEPAAAPTPPPAPRVPTEGARSSPSLADPRPAGPAVRVGARAGIYGRVLEADAAVGTTLRVGGEPGPAGLFDVLMVPASAPDISIFETSIGAGFGWMWTVTPTVGLHLQGVGGVQIHRFRQRGAQTGHRYDWTAELPAGVSFQVARSLWLELFVRGGRAGRAREHRVDDVVVWSRAAWRVGASIGLSYGWRTR